MQNDRAMAKRGDDVLRRKTALGKRLRLIRRAYGDAQHDLALVLGCTRASVSQWEAGKTQPGSDKIEKIIEHYRLPVQWFQWGKGDAPALPEPGRQRHRPLGDPSRGACPVESAGTPIRYFVCPICPPGPPGDWIIPAYALPSNPNNLAVFKSTDDVGCIKQGDYMLIDTNETKILTKGLWLVSMPGLSAPVLVRARVAKRHDKSILEVCMADDLAFDAKTVQTVFGRIVAKFSLTK